MSPALCHERPHVLLSPAYALYTQVQPSVLRVHARENVARTTFEDVGKLDLTIVKLTVTSSKDK